MLIWDALLFLPLSLQAATFQQDSSLHCSGQRKCLFFLSGLPNAALRTANWAVIWPRLKHALSGPFNMEKCYCSIHPLLMLFPSREKSKTGFQEYSLWPHLASHCFRDSHQAASATTSLAVLNIFPGTLPVTGCSCSCLPAQPCLILPSRINHLSHREVPFCQPWRC